MANRAGSVVIVDDDAGFRQFLEDALERAGYETAAYATAEDALAAIDNERPDVLVADVHLPGISGYELCHELKETHHDGVAVVLVSGERTEPFDRAAGILLGADDYLVKPVDPGELLARVRRLAGRSNARQPTINGGDGGKLANLTLREREVLDLLADGSSQDEISDRLFISPKTVATHIQRILTKLGVRSRTQAVSLALKQERDVPSRESGTEEPPRALKRPRRGIPSAAK